MEQVWSLIFNSLSVYEPDFKRVEIYVTIKKSSKNNTPHDAVYGGGCIAILYLT